MPDDDGYPTEEELKVFEKWKLPNIDLKQWCVRDVVEHLESIWWAPDWGFKLYEGREHLFHRKVVKLELHTGGWSGNEDIIAELEQTWFWLLYWVESTRGGHYWFEIPWEVWKKATKELRK